MSNLTITSPNEAAIDEVVKESGLVLTDATEIKGAYLPFLAQLQEVVEQAGKINADNPTDIDEKIARELRLKAVKIRTGSEKLKEDRKKIHLIKGNLEQASYNIIKNSCLLAESALEDVEKAREKKEAARKETLRIERLDLLKPYCDNPEYYPLGEMDESGFNDLLSGMKLQAEAKVKAEQERIEALRLEEERKEKQRAIDELNNKRTLELAKRFHYDYIPRVDEKPLGELSESEYNEILGLAESKYTAILKAEQQVREENERLRIEAEKKEKALQKEREAQEAKLKIAREAQAKAELELRAKQQAEAKAALEAQEAEKKRIAEEKKAAKQPDKIKLSKWVEDFNVADIPTGLSNESGIIGISISNKFDAFKKWAKEQIELL